MGNPIHKELQEMKEEFKKENIKVSNKDLKIIYIIIIVILSFLLFSGIFN
jgi:hypothetical protein